MAFSALVPQNDELLTNFPALCRANWDGIVLGTDANLLITNAKIAAGAGIVDTKLAQIATADAVSGAALVAGSVTNAGLAQITTADKVSGSALTDIIFYENDLVSSDNTIVYH